MARGMGRPPWWAVIVIVASVVLIAVGLPIALARGRVSEASANQMRAENAAVESRVAAQVAAEQPRTVVVIGDSYTAGSGMGGNGEKNWTTLVAKAVPRVSIVPVAVSGAGYVQKSPLNGQTFVDEAKAAPLAGAQLVIVFGSRNDGPGIADQVGQNATQVFDTIKSRAPHAKLLVIGPPWVSAQVPSSIKANRDAVETAAQAAGATFLDPIADRWFFDHPELIGSDGVHPTDAGHAYMAGLIAPEVRQLLGD